MVSLGYSFIAEVLMTLIFMVIVVTVANFAVMRRLVVNGYSMGPLINAIALVSIVFISIFLYKATNGKVNAGHFNPIITILGMLANKFAPGTTAIAIEPALGFTLLAGQTIGSILTALYTVLLLPMWAGQTNNKKEKFESASPLLVKGSDDDVHVVYNNPWAPIATLSKETPSISSKRRV